jgi:anaerobic selenocysteine-containing dehydrogenase
MDHGGCALRVTVQGGRVVKIQGDPHSNISGGYVCPKGLASAERLYHPGRLLHPMVRAGGRGQGRWRRASWQEALGLLSDKILQAVDADGPRSVLFAQGAPKGLEFFLMLRLANALGAPNVAGTQSVCHMPRQIAGALTFGFWPEVDYDHPPACIVLWGSNLDHTNEEAVISSRLRRALDRGSRLVVVDPRPTRMARRADLWLRLRPGTDGALALGVMKALVDAGLHDGQFAQRWGVGFPELLARLRECPMERVAQVTWVPPEAIREAAALLGRLRPSAIQLGNALEHTVLSYQSCRNVMCLMALTGSLEEPGGNFRAGTPPVLGLGDFVLPRRISDRREKMISGRWDLHPMLTTVPGQMATRALLEDDPYAVRVAYLQGTNPLVSYPDASRVKDALERVPFLAVADLFMTPTAALADLVLPAATNFEFDDLGNYGMPHGFVLARPKLVDPQGEAWSDLRILNELGKALGLGAFFWEDEARMLEAVLAPSGLDYAAFRERGVLAADVSYRSYERGGFRTPSGKVEFRSEFLARRGLDPLPGLQEPSEAAGELTAEFPCLLTSGKDPVFFHSAYRQLASLRKISPEPVAEMAPETARSLGVSDGDWVRIRTGRGAIRQRVRVLDGLDPRVVCAAYGWWFPEQGEGELMGWREANLNLLTSMAPPYNPLLGTVNLRAIPCALEREAG